MTFASETIEFRKQVFFLVLTELLRSRPDRDIAHLLHVAIEAARHVSPASFDPTIFMMSHTGISSQCRAACTSCPICRP